MKHRLLATSLLTLVLALGLTPRAHALAFAPDAVLPIESGPQLAALARVSAAANHTSSARRARQHRRHRHKVRHHVHASASRLQAGRGGSPTHPDSQHHPERRAAVPQVTRGHRPTQQGRSGARGAGAGLRSSSVMAASSRTLRSFEHDSFCNFAGDRAAGRGPPRAGPDTNLRRRSRPAFAGPLHLSPTPAPESPQSPNASSDPVLILAHLRPIRPRGSSIQPSEPSRPNVARALEPIVSDPVAAATRTGRVPRSTQTGPPPCVSPAVRVEGATACSIIPSVGGLT